MGRREDELSDTGPLEDEMEVYLFDAKTQNIFYQMFENPELRAAYQPFLNITEEEEYILRGFDRRRKLNNESDSDEETTKTFSSRSQIGYQRLTGEGRKNINKYSKSSFLYDLDNMIYNFIFDRPLSESEFFSQSVCNGRLSLLMKDSHHRLMAHSVSTFYNATSFSELNDNGSKVVIITPPKKYTLTPIQHLVEFLKEERADVSYWTKPNIARPKKRCGMSVIPLSEFSNEANVGWV